MKMLLFENFLGGSPASACLWRELSVITPRWSRKRSDLVLGPVDLVVGMEAGSGEEMSTDAWLPLSTQGHPASFEISQRSVCNN